MNREAAIEIIKRVELAFAHMNEAIEFLKERLDDEEMEAFAELWSPIVGELDLGVLEMVYRLHPDLRPEGMTPVTPLAVDGKAEA